MDHRVLVDVEHAIGSVLHRDELRLEPREVVGLLVRRREREEGNVAPPIAHPQLAQAHRRLALPHLGEVRLLDGKLGLEGLEVHRRLRVAPPGTPGDAKERRAVDALDGLLHPLGGEDAAVVVLQDALRPAPQLIDGVNRGDAEQEQRDQERRLREQQLGAQAHSALR